MTTISSLEENIADIQNIDLFDRYPDVCVRIPNIVDKRYISPLMKVNLTSEAISPVKSWITSITNSKSDRRSPDCGQWAVSLQLLTSKATESPEKFAEESKSNKETKASSLEHKPYKSGICICGSDHEFIVDWIDIDPDRSQQIMYCKFCYLEYVVPEN
jgi:hypothetical protein